MAFPISCKHGLQEMPFLKPVFTFYVPLNLFIQGLHTQGKYAGFRVYWQKLLYSELVSITV